MREKIRAALAEHRVMPFPDDTSPYLCRWRCVCGWDGEVFDARVEGAPRWTRSAADEHVADQIEAALVG